MDNLDALKRSVAGLAYVTGYIIGPDGELVSRKDGTVLDTRSWQEQWRDLVGDPAALLKWLTGEIKASNLSPHLLAEIGAQSKETAQEQVALSAPVSECAALPEKCVIRSDNGEMELDMRSGRFTFRTAVRADGKTVQAGIGISEDAAPKIPPQWIIMKDGQAYINAAILSSLPLKNSAITALYPDGTIAASFSKA